MRVFARRKTSWRPTRACHRAMVRHFLKRNEDPGRSSRASSPRILRLRRREAGLEIGWFEAKGFFQSGRPGRRLNYVPPPEWARAALSGGRKALKRLLSIAFM